MLKIAILQDSEFAIFVIVVSNNSNVDSAIIVINDDVSIPFLPQQVVGFKLVVVVIVKLIIVIVKLIIVVFLVLTFVILLGLLLVLVLVFKTFFFIKVVLQ